MAGLTVHHLERSRSHRILWLLEELGTEYELKVYQRDPKTVRADPALEQVHPLGKSPVITLGDGTVLAESGAMIEELVDQAGNRNLRPQPGSAAHRRFRYWLHYAEGSLMPPLLVKLITSRLRTAPLPFFIKPIAKGIARKIDGQFTDREIQKHYDFIDHELSAHKWFAGEDFTAADIQMSYPLEQGTSRAALDQKHPNIARFLDAIHARPAYQRAIEKGGPATL